MTIASQQLITKAKGPAQAGPFLRILPQKGSMRIPVRLFAPPDWRLSFEQAAALERLAGLPEVEQVVALPDLHLKPSLEAPSSLAIALRDYIALGLSSPSPNCGMAVVKTGLNLADLSPGRLDAVFALLAQLLPIGSRDPSLSSDQLLDVLWRGGEAAVEHYNLPPDTLSHMEQGGNALAGEPLATRQVVHKLVPGPLLEGGRRRFGQVGTGNHFLEFQVIEAILDPATASAWGLEEGQVVAMYHSDSGLLGAFTGRIYAHRRKNSWRGRFWEWRLKIPYHLRHGRPARLPHRIYRYIWPRKLSLMPARSPEGRQAWLALQAASNYAYANRLAVFSALAEAIRQVWGAPGSETSLLWDAPHNSIRPEQIDGREVWVHRHNAARVEPPSRTPADSPYKMSGHPVLLPGTERTSSYLCAAGEGAAFSMLSADHGAGLSALRAGRPLPEPAPHTRVYGYQGGDPDLRSHLSDEGLLQIVEVLQTSQIVRPVASLRPVAVLKAQR